MSECRIAACATRGNAPVELSSVPKVVRKAWTSKVRPRSSLFGMPAAARSRLKMRTSPVGTSSNKASGRVGPWSASQARMSSARSERSGSVFPSRFFSLAACNFSRSEPGVRSISPSVSVRNSFTRRPVNTSVL